MSEYTPTTEEVCEIYWQSGYKTTVEQFDRWLAHVKAEAWDEGANASEDALEAATRERDVALAAVERVRETLLLHNPNGRLVKEVLVALDGAPEPEEKP